MSEGSITVLLPGLRSADQSAQERIWRRYVRQMVRLAREILGSTPRTAADESDVVQSVFDEFFRSVQDEARYPRLNDRSDLFQVLALITRRRVIDRRRKTVNHDKHVVALANLPAGSDDSDGDPVAVDVSDEPTPEEAAIFCEEVQRLLGQLPTEELRAVALDKLAGRTNEEIAALRGVAVRTVERKLFQIRKTWSR